MHERIVRRGSRLDACAAEHVPVHADSCPFLHHTTSVTILPLRPGTFGCTPYRVACWGRARFAAGRTQELLRLELRRTLLLRVDTIVMFQSHGFRTDDGLRSR